MENVLIGQFTGSFDDDYLCRRLATMSSPVPPLGSIYNSFTYAPTPPFHYTPYERLYSSLSLPLHLPYSFPVVALAQLVPHLPTAGAGAVTYGPSLPPLPIRGKATTSLATALVVKRRMGGCKRKKPRTPRSADEPPRAPQRRKPLERATPLPPAPAVAEALDDLEREVTRGFVEDLLHALAPPPSSLPLPTFSLVSAKAAAASCAAV